MIEYWIHVSIPATDASEELIEHFLFEKGSCGLEEKNDRIEAYFEPSGDEGALLAEIREYSSRFPEIDPDAILLSRCPKSDWASKWREYFKPVYISPKLVVKPPWETVPDAPNRIVIDIMPRMAFGTGTHETTQLCIKLLESLIRPGAEVLDVGAGSAILSIAAARLGAARVFGVEIDEDAIENAEENIVLNHVEDRVRIAQGSLDKAPQQVFDFIVANINRAVLVDLIPRFLPFAKPGAILILSGILASEKNMITNVLDAHHLNCLDVQQNGEWLGFHVRKN